VSSPPWIHLLEAATASLLVLWLLRLALYRHARAREAATWRATWAPLARARDLRLETTFSRDYNGGPGYRQTWYQLHGAVGSVAYRVGLGMITYGYDALTTIEAAIPLALPGTLVIAPRGATSPLDGLTAVELADPSLVLFCDDRASATSIASAELQAAVGALARSATGERAAFFTKVCGALLVVRGNHAQVILPIACEALDLPTLDLGVNVVSVLARQATRGSS
jgi:hypothetical protein